LSERVVRFGDPSVRAKKDLLNHITSHELHQLTQGCYIIVDRNGQKDIFRFAGMSIGPTDAGRKVAMIKR